MNEIIKLGPGEVLPKSTHAHVELANTRVA
jgi:hypothetical protein